MKTVKIIGKKKAGLEDVKDLVPKNDLVVIKIHSAPMCTEYHNFENGNEGISFGHEAAGEVVAVDKANTVKVGDRVLVHPQTPCGKCNLCLEGNFVHCENSRDYLSESDNETDTGTMAQYMLKSEYSLNIIPEGLSYDHASMGLCALGPTFGSMQLMNVNSFDTVLISGLGAVGLGGIVNARYRGAKVIGIDTNPYRMNLAKELGAFAVIDPVNENVAERVKELTGGLGADKAIETSGVGSTKPILVDSVRRKGSIALVGWNGSLDASEIIGKGLVIYGAWHYNKSDTHKLFKMIGDIPEQLDRQLTHAFPMRDIQKAWELQCTGQCGKVILHPWE
ncbi:MAG: zinc-binding dehydrogenase [Spirochaetaceae bacterium]